LSGHRSSLGLVIRSGRIIPPGHQIELGCLTKSLGCLAKSSGWVILLDHQIGLGCLATSSVHLAESLGCRAGCLAGSSDWVGWSLAESSDWVGWSHRVVGSSHLISSRRVVRLGWVISLSHLVIRLSSCRVIGSSGRRVIKSGRSAVNKFVRCVFLREVSKSNISRHCTVQ
jgi:hypothetical protein